MAKYCNKCSQNKPLEEFHVNRREKDGRQSYCKSCVRAHYYRNRDKTRRRMSEYSRERLYNVSSETYQRMLVRQCNYCAVCHEWMETDVVVDHCHTTGSVRGLLHRKCNSGIGMLRDDPIILQNAVHYLNIKGAIYG